MSTLPPWRQDLRASLERNRSDAASRYLQLATVRVDGSPANRTVVFRGFAEAPGNLLMVSDTRSDKFAELSRDPRAELAWYFARTREQYRLRGRMILHSVETGTADRCNAAWQALSPAAQAQYFEPAPGIPLDEAPAETEPAIQMLEAPPWFLLLELEAQQVERLDLRPTPQERERYTLTASGWQRQALTP